MQLFLKPHASSLAVHIVLEWVGAEYDTVATDFFEDVLYEHNPTGTVGFLKMADGRVLTQVGAIMKYLARMNPDSGLDVHDDLDLAYQTDRWLLFLTSDVHHAFHLLFLPDRYAIVDNAPAREAALGLCYRNFDILDKHLAGKTFMLGGEKSVVDALLFPMIRWSYMQFPSKRHNYENLNALHDRMLLDQGVKDAMVQEEIWDTITR